DGLARTDAPVPLSQRGDAALHPPLRAERRRRLPLQQPPVEWLAADGRYLRDLGAAGDGRVRLSRVGLRDVRRAPPGGLGYLPVHARAPCRLREEQDALPVAVGGDRHLQGRTRDAPSRVRMYVGLS